MLSEMQQEHADMQITRKYKKYDKQKITYLGMIFYAIQNAPDEKMSFSEIINAVSIFVDGNKKGVANNIRVCLSSNSCFVKVPKNPECPTAKRNFWKVDDGKITPKMVRRHFSALRNVFPDFYKTMETKAGWNVTENAPNVVRRQFRALRNVFPDYCKTKEIKAASNLTENARTCKLPEAEKFTSTFSIDSLLQRESSAPVRPHCAMRNVENEFLGFANENLNLACKRKTWDWPSETPCVNLSRSPFVFPFYNLGQMNYGFSPCRTPSEMMYSVSELPYFTSRDRMCIPSNVVSWAYM